MASSESNFVTDKTVLITGCTAGIGKSYTFMLAQSKLKRMILVARNEKKANDLKKELEEKWSDIEYKVILGDLSKPKDAFNVAKTVVDEEERLDILVSNAGVWLMGKSENKTTRHIQEDGLEMHFATNYLSMVILCKVLTPLLEKSEAARIIVTGSFTGWSIMKGKIQKDNLQGEKKNTMKVVNDLTYAQSKLLQHIWAKRFATTLPENVVINVYDPGMVNTNIERLDFFKKFGPIYPIMVKIVGLRSMDEGAVPGFWLASSEEAGKINGHFADWKISGKPKYIKPVELGYYPNYGMKASESTLNEEEVDHVWDYTEKLYLELEQKYC